MAEVPWPHDCVIATLRRGRRVLIPHGDTQLEAGDVLAVVAEGDVLEVVRSFVLADVAIDIPFREVARRSSCTAGSRERGDPSDCTD